MQLVVDDHTCGGHGGFPERNSCELCVGFLGYHLVDFLDNLGARTVFRAVAN